MVQKYFSFSEIVQGRNASVRVTHDGLLYAEDLVMVVAGKEREDSAKVILPTTFSIGQNVRKKNARKRQCPQQFFDLSELCRDDYGSSWPCCTCKSPASSSSTSPGTISEVQANAASASRRSLMTDEDQTAEGSSACRLSWTRVQGPHHAGGGSRSCDPVQSCEGAAASAGRPPSS
jgi:hypothetical protein